MGIFLQSAWLIPLLPLLGFLLLTLTPIRHNRAASGWLTVLLMLAATVLAGGVCLEVGQGVVVAADGSVSVHTAAEHASAGGFAFPEPNIVRTVRWLPAAAGNLTMGYLIDPAVAAMLLMVTLVSSCIHLFSLGYMAHDARQARFFSFISLFTAAMLLMVISSNLLLFFMAWELMGLCSYLLIGFWYSKTYADPRQITPRQAAIKAFITTRIGDVLLMIGLAYLWYEAGSLDVGSAPGQIFAPEFLTIAARDQALLGQTVASMIGLLLFCGTVGKSAQVPLHVWLPDAMEGPTPVSALIHAATMVAAGVFLVARTYPIFVAGNILPLVTFIGAFTALFAALIACAQFDIKRILAYSTLSQLGFMVAALGVGGWVAAMFHLLMHASFKALLFLGAGSVIHGMEAAIGHDSNATQDIRNMGGLRKFMPITCYTYLAGALALSGLPGLAGFWSKDEILADAFNHGRYGVWLVLTLAALLTAFYMARQVRLVFFGEFRGNEPRPATSDQRPATSDQPRMESDARSAVVVGHSSLVEVPHESPWTMTAPLVLLAVLAVLGGLINLPYEGYHQLAGFFQIEPGIFNPLVMAVSSVVALVGMAGGWWFYRTAFPRASASDPLAARVPGLFRLLNNKFYIDDLYARSVGRLTQALANASNWLDRQVLDRLVGGTGALTLFFGQLNFIIDDTLLNDGADGLAQGTNASGDRVRRLETGRIQDYLALVFLGVVVLGVVFVYALR